MRALFVGGTVDNSELDLDRALPPAHYPENSGGGQSRYRLHHVGMQHRDAEAGQPDAIAYAVYAAPGMAEADIQRISGERDYPRRFDATPAPPPVRQAS